MMIPSLFLGLTSSLLFLPCAQADIIPFIITGAAGDGLLAGNINPPTGETGSGGIGSTGIYFNTNNNLLHVHVNWGSANGYTDLSSDVLALHWHGPTSSSGDAAFGETAPLRIVLSNTTSFDSSASSGGVNANYLIDTPYVQPMLDGRTYINLHLAAGDGGVIRGYMQAVPEPGCLIPVLLISVCLATRRRRD